MPKPSRRGARRRSLALLALTLVAAPAAAQEGFYDRWGNWVPLDPVVPPADVVPDGYRPPGAYYEYEDAPPIYAEPVPEYDAPPGWGRRVVIVPPADLPPPGALRPLRRDELPPEFREDPRGYVIAPDPDSLPAYAPDDGGSRARILVPEAVQPGDGLAPPPQDPGYGLAPPPEDRAPADRDPWRGDWGGALAALDVYAPAKRAAVTLTDPFARLEAIKSANAWLVAQARQPATAATIRAVDRLLGIEVTPDSTMLPGAGTEVKRPKAGDGAPFAERLDALGAFVADRAASDRAGKTAQPENVGGIRLEAEEVAGLDAFLGIGPGGPVVAGN